MIAPRMLQDNVLIVLEPKEAMSKGGIHIPQTVGAGARDHRVARVLSVGPGHWTGCRHCGTRKTTFVPTELVAGDRVIVEAQAGQDYRFDVSVPRHNKSAEFQDICGTSGEFRICREAEILCVIGEASPAEQAA